MQSITTYWWKYYFISFFSILIIDLLISTLTVNIPYFSVIQIGIVFGLWYLISPLIMLISFKMKKAPQELISLVDPISKKFNVRLSKVYIIRDNFLNAFAFGNLFFRGVAITIPLSEALTNEELIAVLSHELAHIRNYDPETMLLSIIFINTIYAISVNYLPFNLFPLILFIYFLVLFPLIFLIHRIIEKRADLTAVKVDPHIVYWLESSLIKIGYLSRDIPYNMLKYVPPLQIFLAKEFIINNVSDRRGFFSFRTHPSLKERLEYLSKYEEQKMYYL